MSDEIKVNSENTLRKNLATLGQVKDALGKRDEQIDSLKEDITSKADKTSLAQTDRKLDALWKLNQGISYEFQTDDAEAYQKTVPSGAKVASIKSIGGKTIVWNQLLDGLETETERTCKDPDNYILVSKDFENNYIPIVGHNYHASFEIFMERTDAYFGIGIGEFNSCGKLNNKSNAWTKITRIVSPKKNSNYRDMFHIFINAEPRTMLAGESFKIRNVNVFDLTLMFGLDNEPTIEEFEAMFPADYYPYNAGELMSAPVNEVMEQGKNLFDQNKERSASITEYKSYRKTSHTIPSVVLELDGYGDGIDNVCNYVDWENKKYHKRIGRYVVTGDEQFYSNPTYIGDNSSDAYMDMDIGQKQSVDAKLISNKLLYLKWCWSTDRTYETICLNGTQIHIRILNSSLGITNEASAVETQNAIKKYCKNLYESGDPIIIYYELAEEKIIDISDILDNTFQEPLEVEAGGTLMFKNNNGDNYRIPVSSTEEYLVSLAEVAK